MFSDNPLLAQLKQQIQENLPKKEGTVKATDKGFGFLDLDGKKSIFIPPPFMKKCLHGDRVSAIIRTENGKDNAEPEELIEHGLTRFVGRVKRHKGKLLVAPDSPSFKRTTLLAKTKIGISADSLNEGDWVVANLINHPLTNKQPFLVEITELVATANDKIAPWWVTLAENDLPNTEPDGCDEWVLNDDNNVNRVDLTHLPFITIDGESTKDMDDALYASKNSDGSTQLIIAIADPTAYIASDSAMDKVARDRGFTIYLPGRNIPMLPRDLADNLCSLIEGEVRPSLCCKVTISEDGSISSDIEFLLANIRSHGQLSYNQVSDWLENVDDCWQPTSTLEPVLSTLNEISILRSSWRERNAIVFKDRPDYRFELDKESNVVAIHTEHRRSANKLVEEAMVTANICAGHVLASKLDAGVFNIHHGLKSDKVSAALELVGTSTESNSNFAEEELNTLEGFCRLRRQISEHGDNYLDYRFRKFQSYGETSNKPAAHFAMGLDLYATWTSPIRKYGDMINHRLLKSIIIEKEPDNLPDEFIGQELALHKKHHRIAERKIADWLYCLILQPEVKNKTVYQGEIFDIGRAGMRVNILENGATAFIPLSLIIDDKDKIMANVDEGKVMIENSIAYKLGDSLELQLHEVNQSTRSIVAKIANK